MGDYMIIINKYLEELGYTQEDLPGYYDEKCDNHNLACSDPRNQDMPEYGFSVYEFFNLDHTLDLLIYPRLCYFRDHCDVGSPGGLTFEEWNKILDKIINAFYLRLTEFHLTKEQVEQVQEGLHLFAEYYGTLCY